MLCEAYYDNGPRFLIFNIAIGVVQLAFGLGIGFSEVIGFNLWFMIFLLFGSAGSFSVLRARWRNSRRCGDYLGLTALLHGGHILTAILLSWGTYTSNQYRLRQGGVSIVAFLFCSIAMAVMAHWHKSVVVPRNDSDPSHPSQQSNPTRFKAFQTLLGPLGSLVFGLAASRWGMGAVPAGHSVLSIVGCVTAGLMYAMYFHKYRTSAWGSVVSLIWSGVVVLWLILAGLIYSTRASTYDQHMQYGFDMVVCFFFAVCFILAFTMKFCLLGEPLHLNFSASPVKAPKSNTVVVSEDTSRARSGFDIEAQPYGMTRAEAEATARKLGFGTDLERDLTAATEGGMSPRR